MNTDKPHIEYNNLTGHWICHSEDGPRDICIGTGENVVEAYRDWLRKPPAKPDEVLMRISERLQLGA